MILEDALSVASDSNFVKTTGSLLWLSFLSSPNLEISFIIYLLSANTFGTFLGGGYGSLIL